MTFLSDLSLWTKSHVHKNDTYLASPMFQTTLHSNLYLILTVTAQARCDFPTLVLHVSDDKADDLPKDVQWIPGESASRSHTSASKG